MPAMQLSARMRRRTRALVTGLPALALLALLAACEVAEEDEVQLGRESAQQVEAQMPLVRDSAVVGYVRELGMVLAHNTARSHLRWEFNVVDSPDINAFALPGGFIYVNRGLIERAGNMSELAGVLGHEIAHVTERHSVEQMKKATGANVGLALLCSLTSLCESGISRAVISVGTNAWFARYSRDDEREADAVAVDILSRARIDAEGVPALFATLLEARERSPGALEGFFASHPLEEDRIAASRAKVEALPAELRQGRRDDPGFQDVRRRLAALPPSPAPRPLPR